MRPAPRPLATTAIVAAVVVGAMLLAPTSASAHAELVSSIPAGDAELETPPTEVLVVFDDELDPASSGFVVTDAGGAEVGNGEVDLDVAQRNELRGPTTIDGPGTYTVAWTATAADGHAEEGSFAFTVLDTRDGSAEAPDTALSEPDGGIGPEAALGVLLLVVAVRVARQRMATRPVSRS